MNAPQYDKSVCVTMQCKFLFLCMLFVISNHCSPAQTLRFDHLTVKQGLSQNNIDDIMQDSLGFIWVATEDGLNMYDGYTFTVFRNQPNDSTTISNNNVHCLQEDSKGNLWVGTQNGLNRYDRNLHRFEQFMPDGKPGSISNGDVVSIFFDSNENMWVATSGGLNLFDPATKTFTHFVHDPNDPTSIPDNLVKYVIEDHRKRLWVASSGGLSLMRPDKKTFTNFYSVPSDPTTLSTNKLTYLFEDKNNVLWIGTFDGGLNKMNPDNTFVRYLFDPTNPKSLGNNYVYAMMESHDGEFWIATDGALNKMDREAGTFTQYHQIQGNETGINSNIVTKVYFDINNRMWVGTRFGGINIYDKEKYGFAHFSYNNYDKYCLNNNNVSNFLEDDNGNLWVSTDGGSLNYFDRSTGRFTNLLNKFTNNKILAIEQDSRGGLWLGMWAGGVNYYDTRTGQVKKYLSDPNDPNTLSDNNIFDIMRDSEGNIWVATWGNGLNRYNAATDNFTRFVHNDNDPNSINSSPIGTILEDSQGKIWIGTEQFGLDVLDPETGIFTHHLPGTKEGELKGRSILSLFEDSNKRIWAGSLGQGVSMYDPATKKFENLTQDDGLPNNAIVGIVEDKSGNIWFSTYKGLSRYNPKDKTFKNFTESDGLQGDQYNRWAYGKLSTGELLFGGTNGFNMFNPENIKANTYVPPVYVTDFKLFNKSVAVGQNEILKSNVMVTDEIVLSYDQNIFSFDFTALNYRQPEKNKYKYIMEGFQDEWIDNGTERKVSFTNLSPGEYVFRVIASNNDGVWNQEGRAIRVTIVPPFWKTLWFNTLVTLLVIASVIGYFRYQRVKAKRQQEELQAIIEERTSELKIQNEEILRKSEQERVQNWITEGLALISETISKNNGDLEKLTHETLKALAKYVGAQQGALAVAVNDDPEDVHLKIIASYGGTKGLGVNKRIEVGSGLIGATFQDKQKTIIDNVPADYVTIESGLGTSKPAALVLVPLKTEDGEIVGVVELAFLNELTETAHVFLEKVSSVIALNIVAANLSHQTMMLLQSSKEQTEEMRAQEEEMRQSMEELEATTEEFRRREQEYQRKIFELESALKKA